MAKSIPLNVDCIVLAAGCSSRFGATKLLAKIGDESMIRRVLKSVGSSNVSTVHLVVGHDADRVQQEAKNLCHKVVVNSEFQEGMGTSIAAGIKSLSAHCDAILIVLGDQPLVSPTQIDALIEAWLKKPELAVLSGYADASGPPSLFPRSLFHKLASLRGDAGARSWLEPGEFEVLEFEDAQQFVDIDTQEELKDLVR